MKKNFSFFSKKESVQEALWKSSALSFLSRVLGYIKYLAIAVFLGFNSKTDDYFMAIGLLGLFTIFVDVFNSIGVPNLVLALKTSEKEFNDLAGILLSFTTVLAFTLSFIALFLAPILPHIAVGFSQANQKIVEQIFLLFIPFLFFSFFFIISERYSEAKENLLSILLVIFFNLSFQAF